MYIQYQHQDNYDRMETGLAGNKSKPKSQHYGKEDKDGRNTATKYCKNFSDRSWKNHIKTSMSQVTNLIQFSHMRLIR